MIVRGIDPGTHETAWCDLAWASEFKPFYAGSGTVASADALTVLYGLAMSPDVLAIERPRTIHVAQLRSPAKAVATVEGLLAASWLGGELSREARRSGLQVYEVEPRVAREGIGVHFGNRGGKRCSQTPDQQIKSILRTQILIPNWPVSTSNHVRDAAVAALHAIYLMSHEGKAS